MLSGKMKEMKEGCGKTPTLDTKMMRLRKTKKEKGKGRRHLWLREGIPLFLLRLIAYSPWTYVMKKWNPRHTLALSQQIPIMDKLLEYGMRIDTIDKDGATPLHYAVKVGALQTVKLLIKYKVDVNVPDNDGWTPLHIAIQSMSRDIAKVLLVNGADKIRRNKDGKTLDVSLSHGRDFKSYEVAKLLKLVPYGVDP